MTNPQFYSGLTVGVGTFGACGLITLGVLVGRGVVLVLRLGAVLRRLAMRLPTSLTARIKLIANIIMPIA